MSGKSHRIREKYEATAQGYDELYRAEQYEKYFAALRRVPPSGRVLDAGCGTGLLIEFLALQGLLRYVEEYVCLDYSGNMLRIAAGRARLYCRGKCSIVEGNVESLPFRDKAFDTVYSFTVLDLVDSLERAVQELVRVSRGPVVVSMLKKLPYKDMLIARETSILAVTSKDVIFILNKHNAGTH